ncbi:MAG: electron transfer flavoprotein subunit beta [Kiritimatiellae bacterium]|nr:electron transfer flavoprotein subunit beta [Kiritimatiellia bacterium]
MKNLTIVVCASLVPDPLQTLEPAGTNAAPALKNELMLPGVLDPWAACALYEAAAIAKKRPGTRVVLVSLGPKQKLQQLMMNVAQKAPFELVAVNAPAGGFNDAKSVAAALAAAIKTIPNLDLASTLLFGGCASASRDAGLVVQFVAEGLGIGELFMAVDELTLADDGALEVLERVEGGKYLKSKCTALPAAVAWATGSLPEPPNNPMVGMQNMRTLMPALAKAQTADVGLGTIAYESLAVPSAKRDTKVVKDMPADEIAKEIVAWIKQ